jgi:ribosomal protein S18 acetylase RimI-like enzyme
MSTKESTGRALLSQRPVTGEDQRFLLELYISTRADEFAPFGWDQRQLEALLRMQFEAQRNSYRMYYPDAEQSIIQHEGLDVGQMIVDNTAGRVLLVDISILPQYRNRGIGASVLTRLLNGSQSQGEKVVLNVLRNSSAVRLYSRLGFDKVGETDTHWEMVWMPSSAKH